MQSPPHNLEAEQALLGAMLISPDALHVGLTQVSAHQFYGPSHQAVFAAIATLVNAGRPVDVVTVTSQLNAEGHHNIGTGDLMSYSAGTPAATNAEHYANIVDDLARRRDLLVSAHELASNVGADISAQDLLAEHQRRLFDIAAGNSTDTLEVIGDSLAASVDAIEAQSRSNGAVTGTPTGFTDLDKLTSGLQPSTLTVIGGRPSMGKTSLALDIVRHIAGPCDRPVILFSLEMSKLELTKRLLCSQGRIDSTRIRLGKLSDQDWANLADAVDALSKQPLWLVDTPDISLATIRAQARRVKAKTGDLAAVVVDYLQLMTGRTGADNRQVEIAELSRGLKILARELDCPVIALSQLSRQLEQRTNKRPMLSDLRESGAIEQDADNVLFLYRDEVYNATSEDLGMAEVILAKHRNGPTGTLKVAWLPHFTTFRDLARQS